MVESARLPRSFSALDSSVYDLTERNMWGSSPVFLIGAQRSGSTLLRVMLNAHPQISCERHREIETGLRLIDREGKVPTELSGYYAELDANDEFCEGEMVIDESLEMDRLLQEFWNQGVYQGRKPVHIGTVHRSFPRILEIWPNARFLYLYRDGRDVARSHVKNGWAGNFWSGIDPWIKSEEDWKSMKRSLSSDAYVEVRYEELVKYPRVALTVICDFLGISYTSEIFGYSHATNFKPPDQSLTYQWKRYASEEEIQAAEAHAGKYLRARRYELSGLPALQVDSRTRGNFARRGIWKQRILRIRRFGATSILLDVLARHLRLSRLRKRTALAMSRRRRRASS